MIRRALIQLGISFVLLIVVFLFSIPFPVWPVAFVAVMFFFMALVDLGRAFRRHPSGSGAMYVAGLAIGLPQLLLSLASLLGGIVIAVATLFWPEARNHWWIYLVGPGLIVFGIVYTRDALTRRQPGFKP